MDRLVCGDVGFGKTEVAIRAAFRVGDGRQAGRRALPDDGARPAALPHLRGADGELPDHTCARSPASRRKKEQDDDARAASRTARSTSSSAPTACSRRTSTSSDLGLLVVDEEQRFGVTHKERIKQLTHATSTCSRSRRRPSRARCRWRSRGLRDLSLITTPPVDRRADPHHRDRATTSRSSRRPIGRELVARRSGLLRLQPHRGPLREGRSALAAARARRARIARRRTGRCGEDALEQTMLDFVEGRYDVLCATAIIESGLDIPRANTIIIDRADMFGLAQLYQLRGRVGRSKERAYCYLIVPPPNAMTDEARARIEALERHTELGSRLPDRLARSRAARRGRSARRRAARQRRERRLRAVLLRCSTRPCTSSAASRSSTRSIPSSRSTSTALLPEDYVADVGVRLSLYKRLASAIDEARRRRDRGRDGGPLRPAARRRRGASCT